MAEHIRCTRNRREFLTDAFCGFGSLAFASMLAEQQAQAAPYSNPLGPKPPHMAAKAKSIIFLFMAGRPSHMETFDPKPLLNELHGQKRPKEFGEAKYQFVTAEAKLLGSKRTFKKYGKSGIEVSDLLPHMAECVDDLAIIRSMHGDMVVHSAAQYQMMTGRIIPGFPSMGSWVIYGLGSESDSLPAYAVIPDPKGALEAGQVRGGGSDDVGDISWNMPMVYMRYPANIPNLPGHHWANAVAMATPIAHKGSTAGAKVQVMTTLDFLLKPAKFVTTCR